MKKKSKIIIASCVLAVILLTLVTAIVINRFQSERESGEGSAQVWKETPFDYSQTITKYASYKEPFREAVSGLQEELKEMSEEKSSELGIVSAYMTENETPTMIIAYDNPEGGNNVMICKYEGDTFYKTFILGGNEKLGDGCGLLMVQGSDVIAFRSGLCETAGVQSLYDFEEGGKYSSVRSESYDLAPFSENMDKTLAEYLAVDNPVTLSYCELALTSDVETAIDDFLTDK